jgi:hypothetical protein
VVPEAVRPLAEAAELLPRGAIVAGELSPEQEAALRRGRRDLRFAPPLLAPRRAAALAALGLRRLAAGPPDPPEALEPLYLRGAHITTPSRKS